MQDRSNFFFAIFSRTKATAKPARSASHSQSYNGGECRIHTISESRIHRKAKQMFQVLHDLAPARLSNFFRDSCSANNYHLGNADDKLTVPLPKTEFLKKSFSYNGVKIWNSLPTEIRSCKTLSTFDELISTHRLNVTYLSYFVGLYLMH